MVKYQQGDVLFKQVDPQEFRKKRDKDLEVNSQGRYNSYHTMEITSQYYNDKEPEGELDGGKCTVALGEATGHHHSFMQGSPGVVVTAYKQGWLNSETPARCHYVAVEQGHATVTHQEHKPITLPSGYYKVEIVREFDHLGQMERAVVD